MPEYSKEKRGVLFSNDRRTTDSHPHYQGQCELDGVSYWLSGWVKQPKNGGNDFVSLSFKDKQTPKDAPKPDKDDENLRGVLFINERKDTDAKPDYTGRCTIANVEWYLSAWIKAPREAGDDFISIEFEKSAARSTGRLDAKGMLAQAKSRVPGKTTQTTRTPIDDEFDSSIPF